MNAFWKWLAVAGCGVGLLVAVDRLRMVRADDDAPAYARSEGGDSLDRLERIVEKLGRVVERMEHGGPPPHDRPPHDRPPHDGDGPRGEPGRPPHGHRHHAAHGPGPMWDEMSPERKERIERWLEELPPEVRERAEKRMEEGRRRMAEMKDRMEQARARFREMEERIAKLESEVADLKSAK